jgi:metal transporter CNNM
VRDVRVDIDGQKPLQENVLKPKIPIQKWKSFPNTNKSNRGSSRSRKWTKNMYSDILEIDGSPLPNVPEEEAVGIITMEDVIEELLQVLTIFLNKSVRKQSYLPVWTV